MKPEKDEKKKKVIRWSIFAVMVALGLVIAVIDRKTITRIPTTASEKMTYALDAIEGEIDDQNMDND